MEAIALRIADEGDTGERCDRCDHAAHLHYLARDLARAAPPLCSAICLGPTVCPCDQYVPASWRWAA